MLARQHGAFLILVAHCPVAVAAVPFALAFSSGDFRERFFQGRGH
jgi:hypothetical protein